MVSIVVMVGIVMTRGRVHGRTIAASISILHSRGVTMLVGPGLWYKLLLNCPGSRYHI